MACLVRLNILSRSVYPLADVHDTKYFACGYTTSCGWLMNRPTVPSGIMWWLQACNTADRCVVVTDLLYRQSLCFGYWPAVSTVAMIWLLAYCADSRSVLVTCLLYRQSLCFGYRPTVPTVVMFWLLAYYTDSGYVLVTGLLYRPLLCVGCKAYFKFCVSFGRLIILTEIFLWLSSVSSSKYCVIILNKPRSNTSTSFPIRHS